MLFRHSHLFKPLRHLNQPSPFPAMDTNRLWRTLSAFNHSTRRWAPIPLGNAQSQVTSRNTDTSWTQRLSLISWNIDAFSSRSVSRAKLILGHILDGPKSPDI